jgi:Domain of unknown function (DUF4864)
MSSIGLTAGILRLALVLILYGGWGPGSATAQEAIAPSDQSAIRSVIEGQIAAFRRDDGVAAFSFASPAIRGIFGTPGQFMEMVRSGYQPVYRPRSIAFQELDATPSGWIQPVVVVGPDGRSYLALYSMQRQEDGSWRINGCHLVTLPEESV